MQSVKSNRKYVSFLPRAIDTISKALRERKEEIARHIRVMSRSELQMNGRGDILNPKKIRKRYLRGIYVTRKMKRINRTERLTN